MNEQVNLDIYINEREKSFHNNRRIVLKFIMKRDLVRLTQIMGAKMIRISKVRGWMETSTMHEWAEHTQIHKLHFGSFLHTASAPEAKYFVFCFFFQICTRFCVPVNMMQKNNALSRCCVFFPFSLNTSSLSHVYVRMLFMFFCTVH